jgi:hypothetical protein
VASITDKFWDIYVHRSKQDNKPFNIVLLYTCVPLMHNAYLEIFRIFLCNRCAGVQGIMEPMQ